MSLFTKLASDRHMTGSRQSQRLMANQSSRLVLQEPNIFLPRARKPTKRLQTVRVSLSKRMYCRTTALYDIQDGKLQTDDDNEFALLVCDALVCIVCFCVCILIISNLQHRQ